MSAPQQPGREVAEDLARQALDNLVNQFARPLDFLRELVQNAIDAGTPRVDVWFRWQPPSQPGHAGVLEIHVDDYGEGMDERIIDGELTRMFASSKEDDLTKIGKFGIGFTSIFAIQPDAVLLRTGRHEEFWELLFHPDRSFDKVRIDEPVYGTKITLLKAMARGDVASFAQRCKGTLTYWLEHSDVPVRFAAPDLAWTGESEADAPLADDPFAAFAAPAEPSDDAESRRDGHEPFEQLNSPLSMDTPVQVALDHPDLVGFVGYDEHPTHAFYNGGLTLVRGSSGEALGEFARELGHFAFKVKGRHLEHTLTRDNVLHDEAWADAMNAVAAAVWELRPRLLERIREETRPDGAPDRWLRMLARDCARGRAHRHVHRFDEELVLPGVDGAAVTFAAVLAQDRKLGYVLVASPHAALNQALVAEGYVVLADRPAVRALLRATWDPSWLGTALLHGLSALGVHDVPFLRREQPIVPADAVFALPQLTDEAALSRDEKALAAAASRLLRDRSGLRVRLGDFGGLGVASELALEGPADGGLFQRTQRRALFSTGARCLLVNRHHEVVRAQVAVAHERPMVAAYGLLAAALSDEELLRGALEVATAEMTS